MEICCEIGVKLLTMIALASFLIAIVCGLLWMGLVAPAILRFFGVPVAIGDWMLERRNQRLSRTQYIWAGGVFQWGVGMFVFFTLSKYLEWRLLGDRFSYLSLDSRGHDCVAPKLVSSRMAVRGLDCATS